MLTQTYIDLEVICVNDGSEEAIELVRKFVARLEEIPDGCAECFPFEMVDELKESIWKSRNIRDM